MSAASVFFPFGVRLTTWLTFASFVLLAVRRRDARFVIVAWIWLLGFEAAWDVSEGTIGHGWGPVRFIHIAVGVFTIAWFAREGIRPSRSLLLTTAVIWVAWLATGFHDNEHTLAAFNWPAEVLNVASKTALAVAYLWPLLVAAHPARVDLEVASDTDVELSINHCAPRDLSLPDRQHLELVLSRECGQGTPGDAASAAAGADKPRSSRTSATWTGSSSTIHSSRVRRLQLPVRAL